jgi:hypothetical protein
MRPLDTITPDNKRLRVFIPSAPADEVAIGQLYDRLVHDNFLVWSYTRDRKPDADSFAQADDALRKANIALICISQRSHENILKDLHVRRLTGKVNV